MQHSNKSVILYLSVILITLTSNVSSAQTFTVSSFAPDNWSAVDSFLGITGFNIEDFEDVNLISGLTYQTENLAETNTIPNLFDPTTDPFGSAFVSGNWDGNHVLINTFDNQSKNYSVSSNWEIITFNIVNGATVVGFSLEQMQTDVALVVNGQNLGGVLSLGSNLVGGGGRNGYLLVSADSASSPITSLSIDNMLSGSTGDGYVFDRFAFSSVTIPELSDYAAFLGLGALGLAYYRRISGNKTRLKK